MRLRSMGEVGEVAEMQERVHIGARARVVSRCKLLLAADRGRPLVCEIRGTNSQIAEAAFQEGT